MFCLTDSVPQTVLSWVADNFSAERKTPLLWNHMVHHDHESPPFELIPTQFYLFHIFTLCNISFKIIHIYKQISSHNSTKPKFCKNVSHICLPPWFSNNPLVVLYGVHNKVKVDQKFHGSIIMPGANMWKCLRQHSSNTENFLNSLPSFKNLVKVQLL
jgi:hypothetical protein